MYEGTDNQIDEQSKRYKHNLITFQSNNLILQQSIIGRYFLGINSFFNSMFKVRVVVPLTAGACCVVVKCCCQKKKV